MAITAAQPHSTKSELSFCAHWNPVGGVSEIRDGEDPWQWSRLGIRLNSFRRSVIPQKQFIIIIIIIITIIITHISWLSVGFVCFLWWNIMMLLCTRWCSGKSQLFFRSFSTYNSTVSITRFQTSNKSQPIDASTKCDQSWFLWLVFVTPDYLAVYTQTFSSTNF